MEYTTPSGLLLETRQNTPPGVEVIGEVLPAGAPPTIIPSPWAGWPSGWATPNWQGTVQLLTDTAWACLDSNANIISTMPPYLVDSAPSLDSDWLNNPDPSRYSSWCEFMKQLVWDFQGAGESFVIVTARYSTGYPARFHILPPWLVNAEINSDGERTYSIGGQDVTQDICHIRYKSTTDDAHGHSPLEIAGPRLVAASSLARYANELARTGGIPTSILTHPGRLTKEQAETLQTQWVAARMNSLGLPAVLSGGVDFKALSLDPEKLAWVDLSNWNEARIAILLSVPPYCMGLPSSGDPMTYSNVAATFDYRWRAGLNPLVKPITEALSNWLLPRGTTLELNRDEFVRPAPLERAQAAKIWNEIGALSVQEIAERERFNMREILPS